MIKDEVLALCELSNDLLFHKIPEEKIMYYIRESLKAGKEEAILYKGADIQKLCKEHNIEVEYIKESKKTYGVSFRAQTEMDQKHCKIWIFEGSIKELSKHSHSMGRRGISYDEALNIHLSHEFFHYIEFKKENFVGEKLEPIVRINLPFLKKKGIIQRCSEIAAHSFAKELIGLNELPNIFDYLYLIKEGQMKEKEFNKMINSYEVRLL
ncbi:MAG: hypothetical protein ACK5JH_11870 [Anaerocolumna sp.]